LLRKSIERDPQLRPKPPALSLWFESLEAVYSYRGVMHSATRPLRPSDRFDLFLPVPGATVRAKLEQAFARVYRDFVSSLARFFAMISDSIAFASPTPSFVKRINCVPRG
jgi:hypothetical protein